MKTIYSVIILFFFLNIVSLFSFVSFASVLEGVTISDHTQANNQPLSLNGVGVRKASFLFVKVKVYVAALYLEKPSHNPEEILESNQVKKIEMNFVHDVSADKLRKAWNESFENNCKAHCSEMRPLVDQLNSMMVDIQNGDKVTLTFFPNYLEVIMKNQEPKKVEGGPDFSKLVLSSWLGAKPP